MGTLNNVVTINAGELLDGEVKMLIPISVKPRENSLMIDLRRFFKRHKKATFHYSDEFNLFGPNRVLWAIEEPL
jgi:hypothetical protein